MKPFFTIILTLSILSFYSSSNAQSLGNSLEFHSTVFMSNDTIYLGGSSSIKKTFTVPAGTVLKITTLYLQNSSSSLAIDNQKIIGLDFSTSTPESNRSNNYSGEQAIWVGAGKTVTLETSPTNSRVRNVWLTGVVFKVVSN